MQPRNRCLQFPKKNGLATSDAKVPGGWRLFTQKHPSFVSFSQEWVFGVRFLHEGPQKSMSLFTRSLSRDFVDPSLRHLQILSFQRFFSARSVMCALSVCRYSILRIRNMEVWCLWIFVMDFFVFTEPPISSLRCFLDGNQLEMDLQSSQARTHGSGPRRTATRRAFTPKVTPKQATRMAEGIRDPRSSPIKIKFNLQDAYSMELGISH